MAHWIENLPEFGKSPRLMSLIEELQRSQSEIEYHARHILAVEREILAVVLTVWRAVEVADAIHAHRINEEKNSND